MGAMLSEALDLSRACAHEGMAVQISASAFEKKAATATLALPRRTTLRGMGHEKTAPLR